MIPDLDQNAPTMTFMTTDNETDASRPAELPAGDQRPAGAKTAAASGSGGMLDARSRRFNMHQRAAFVCLGLAVPFLLLSPPVATCLILCGITSFSIGLLVKHSQEDGR